MPDAGFALCSYDAIILDYMLGQGGGLQWLQVFKRRGDCPPVLFLTGAGNEIIAVRAMKAGDDDYQRKQELTRERLIASLRAMIRDGHQKTLPPDLAAGLAGESLGHKIRIPGFKGLRLVGEGGLSRVYLAARDSDDEPLGGEILRSEIIADTKALARFMEEYSLVESIQSRHVARIHGHGTSE